VLKITTTRNDTTCLTVHLWGQLTGEYVPELQKALNPDAAPQIVLDMDHVTFVDRTALEFLCSVKSRVDIQNIPLYVRLWIEQEFRCGRSSKNSRTDS
jgi:anti-anti-sigma regulatory factor